MRDAICSSARPARTPGPGRDWAFVIAGHNHFDPTWRRCFDRPAIYNGVTVRGYADLEELVMKAWLGLAGRGYTMSEGQTAIWRMYLERNPGDLARLQAEVKAGAELIESMTGANIA